MQFSRELAWNQGVEITELRQSLCSQQHYDERLANPSSRPLRLISRRCWEHYGEGVGSLIDTLNLPYKDTSLKCHACKSLQSANGWPCSLAANPLSLLLSRTWEQPSQEIPEERPRGPTREVKVIHHAFRLVFLNLLNTAAAACTAVGWWPIFSALQLLGAPSPEWMRVCVWTFMSPDRQTQTSRQGRRTGQSQKFTADILATGNAQSPLTDSTP